jgi:microcystin-dependent protein
VAQPYVGEIRMFAGNFAPVGWHFCDGSLLPIAENETLFQLIGTVYGGDGESTFGVPDLRGRVPIHFGGGQVLGEMAGVETVTLNVSQLPTHTHQYIASTSISNQTSPQNNLVAQSTAGSLYIEDTASATLAPNAILPAGEGHPHDNMQPFLCVSFIISLFGIFPSPT